MSEGSMLEAADHCLRAQGTKVVYCVSSDTGLEHQDTDMKL